MAGPGQHGPDSQRAMLCLGRAKSSGHGPCCWASGLLANYIIGYVVELKMTYWPLLHFFHVLWVFLLSCLIHLCLLQGIKTVMKTPKSETPISKMESRDIGKDTIGSKTLTVENSSYFVERKLHIWDSNHRAS